MRANPSRACCEDPKASAELKQRLETVRAARDFASRELGLPNNKSYTSYADLKREYVVWSVVATPGVLGGAARVVLSHRRLRGLPRLLQGSEGARSSPASCATRASTPSSRVCLPIRRWENSMTRS